MKYSDNVTKIPAEKLIFYDFFIQLTFTCLKSTIETLQKRCEICSKLTIRTLKRRQ